MEEKMMKREELFSKAVNKSKEALEKAPFMFPLESVIKQLHYLIEVDKGVASKDRLSTINIGQIAARDIDEFDEELADLLHEVSAEVDELIKE
jgi:hypothetical protein